MEKAKRLAFKKFLDKYAVTKNYPPDSVILWEKYLVYGTVLGVSTKALSQFSIAFPSNNELKGSGLYTSFSRTNGIKNINSFTTNLINELRLISFATKSGSSGVGGSGSFSGGGGGGGGSKDGSA